MVKSIWKMDLDFGRQGALDGIFVCEDTKLYELINSNEELYFGEVLGKHSEVSCIVDETDFKKVTEDPEVVAMFEKHELHCGFNPFHYVSQD